MKPCTVEYTVTITNDGAADYAIDPQAAVSDDMADVLDDATYNADAVAVASDGSALPAPSVVAPTLSWAGPVAVGESVTITYSVTVTNLGDHDLVNVATPLCGDGVECEPPTTVEIELPSITPAKASDPATGAELVAGDVVTYTLSFTNDGQVAGPVDATDDLSGMLDDASITSEPIVDAAHAAAITADLDLAAETIRVTGELAPGETTTVTYQVTILADGERGDNVAGNVLTPDVPPYECAADDPDCDPFVPPTTEHLIGELDDWKTVDPASGATVKPGQLVTVSYTVTVNADGERGDDQLANFLVDAGGSRPPSALPATMSARTAR